MPFDIDARVVSNTPLSDSYHVLALDAAAIADATRPGQFVMLKPSAGLEPLLRRPFSVFEVLRDERGAASGITVLSKRVGVGTSLLYQLRAGDRLACLGPLGRPFTAPAPGIAAWLVAGGVGLAPFATLAEACLAQRSPVTLFYGARSAHDLFYAGWFAERGVEVVVTTEDGSAGSRGFVTVPLEARLAAQDPGAPPQLYACGPTPMMRAVGALAQRFGHDVEVSLEQTMGCGLGGCYSCVVRVVREDGPPHFVRSCLAGPTFRSSAIVWAELPA